MDIQQHHQQQHQQQQLVDIQQHHQLDRQQLMAAVGSRVTLGLGQRCDGAAAVQQQQPQDFDFQGQEQFTVSAGQEQVQQLQQAQAALIEQLVQLEIAKGLLQGTPIHVGGGGSGGSGGSSVCLPQPTMPFFYEVINTLVSFPPQPPGGLTV